MLIDPGRREIGLTPSAARQIGTDTARLVVEDPVAECLPRSFEVGTWEVVPILRKIVV